MTITDVFLDEEMDMPCPCECGRWFDLNDGVSYKERVYCKKCGTRKRQIAELREDIEDLELEIDNGNIKRREGKKQIKELLAKITILEF